MSADLTIRGIEELKVALAQLPADLKGQATSLVVDAAYAAQADIVSAYPEGPPRKKQPSGNLKKGVRVTIQEMGAFGVAAKVASTAFHNWLYEHGSQARYYITKNGKRHETGRMPQPPAPVFIPTMIRHRRALYAQLATLIERAGLRVKVG